MLVPVIVVLRGHGIFQKIYEFEKSHFLQILKLRVTSKQNDLEFFGPPCIYIVVLMC